MPATRITLSFFATLLFYVACFQIRAETSLVPGVKLYARSPEVEGRLVFLAANQDLTRPGSNETASIYLYDLRKRALRKITDCPDGDLVPSRTADFFCVLSYDVQSPAARRPFLYSDASKKSCTVQLERPPTQAVLIGHHAFFLIDRAEYILNFDFDTRTETFIGFQDRASWGAGRIGQLSQNLLAPGARDTLHFMYHEKEQPTEAARHETGFYDLDILSGRIEWSPQQEDPSLFFRAFNGEFVYFTGPDSPLYGTKLVMAPWETDRLSPQGGPQAQVARTLHVFPRHKILGGAYGLECLSPDGKYALVSYRRASGRWRTFYVVNLRNGKTDLFLKDRTRLGGPLEYYSIWWLP